MALNALEGGPSVRPNMKAARDAGASGPRVGPDGASFGTGIYQYAYNASQRGRDNPDAPHGTWGQHNRDGKGVAPERDDPDAVPLARSDKSEKKAEEPVARVTFEPPSPYSSTV